MSLAFFVGLVSGCVADDPRSDVSTDEREESAGTVDADDIAPTTTVVSSPDTNQESDPLPADPRAFAREVIDGAPLPVDGCCLDVVTAGDVDGDGDGDVIIGAENADGLVWYQNPGEPETGIGWSRFVIGAGDFTTDGVASDLDDDGDLDVVASSIDRNVVEWWEQVGDPSSTDGWIRHDIGPDFAHDLVIADIDGDGMLDVGAYHTEAQRSDWFQPPDDPTGSWTQHVVDDRFGEGIAAGDLDDDGDVDLVAGPAIYFNDDGAGTEWSRRSLGDDWPDQVRTRIADIDEDGTPDVVMVSDETEGRLSWLRGPDWTETVIDESAGFTHSLEVGDVDLDGHLDLLAGVMHTASEPLVRVLFGDGGSAWSEVVLATTGTHNARLFDLDRDGRLDVVGKNYDGPKQVEVWWSRATDLSTDEAQPETELGSDSPLDGFTYVQVDDERQRFNDSTAFFGLAFADVDDDGDDDIASGRYLYLNPGSDMSTTWERIDLAEQIGVVVDVMLATDVDDDDRADLIATALPDVWWLEVGDDATTWSGRQVATVPATSRPNGQGYRLGDLTADGRSEIILSGGASESEVWYVEVPMDPEMVPWPATRVTSTATDEQIGIGDIDGDGWNDIAAGDMYDGGSYIAWFENPGDGSGDWRRHRLGEFPGVFPDRLDVLDLDGDARLDVVVSEENDGSAPDAEAMWYRQPADPKASDWERHVVVEQYTTNGLDTADLDGDGDFDLVTGEHRGPRRVSIWENLGGADGDVNWIEHPVDEGKESHLGARVWDLDHDGDFEIVSIAWDEPQYLHLWVND